MKLLIKYTETPNTPDKVGITPYQYAKQNRHKKVVKILKPYTNNPPLIMDCPIIFLMIFLILFGGIGPIIGLLYISFFYPQFALFFYPFLVLLALVCIVNTCYKLT